MVSTMTRLSWIALIGILFAPAAVHAQSEEVVYYHTDAIGSVRMITNAAGVEIDRYDFLPFGERLPPPSPPPPDTRQFAGKEQDAETDLDYFGARYYRAQSGRFTSVDPKSDLEIALVDPQRWNRYSYVGNRSTRIVDPDGRGWVSTLFKVGTAVAKGEDLYSTVSSVVEDTSTIFSMDARVGTGDRLWATGDLLMELSGAADVAGGAKHVASMAVRGGGQAAEYAKSIRKQLGRLTGGIQEAAHAHHMLPRRFGAIFKRAGLDINDPRYGAWWEAQDHLRNAKGYNKQWEDFFRTNKDATAGEILEFGRALAEKYGVKILF